MTDDKGNDWDNQWGVGFESSQKEHYYKQESICFRTPKCTPITPIIRVFHVINKFHASKLVNNSKRRYFLFIKQVK